MDVDETRDEYIDRFSRLAKPGLEELCSPGRIPHLAGGRIDDFHIEDDGDTAHAVTHLTFRGRTFHYRRQIWPPDFPLQIKTSLYLEHLFERIITGRYAPTPPDTAIRL